MYDLKGSKKLLTEDRPIFDDLEGSRPTPRPRTRPFEAKDFKNCPRGRHLW